MALTKFKSRLKYILSRSNNILHNDGVISFGKVLLLKIYKDVSIFLNFKSEYDDWIIHSESIGRTEAPLIDESIKISLIIPAYRIETGIFKSTISSVLSQTYKNWEMCISLCEVPGELVLWLEDLKDSRIKKVYLKNNFGISGNTNEAIKLASGAYIGFLDHDDLLSHNALTEVVRTIIKEQSDLIYTDEDKINLNGKRFDPHFKPDFSPELLLSMNYICHFVVVKKDLGDDVGWLKSSFDGSQDHDFLLRCIERNIKITHIPEILYHWRVTATSVLSFSGNKEYATDAGINSIKEHCVRMGISGANVLPASEAFTYKFQNETADELVSIIIPNKDQVALLSKCLDSVLNLSTYKNVQIIIVENNSVEEETFSFYKKVATDYQGKVKVLVWEKEFNYSAINNYAVSFSSGKFLIFLNNDIEVISPQWIERLIDHGQRSEIGIVGAKLYYADNTIQHAGVIVGIGGIAGHSHKFFTRSSRGYCNRLNVIQNVSAVTGACLFIKKCDFDRVNGFDEDLKVAFNDVDLCLRILKLGLRVVWTPYAELYHYESKTRGSEDTPAKYTRFQLEMNLMKNRWGSFLRAGDPYYNRNLTLLKEDFSIKNFKFEKVFGE